MQNLLTVILAGGAGNRLRPLTDRRAKPAVHFAGHRLIDFTIGNCLLSGVPSATVLTQYRAESVEDHLRRSYRGRTPRVEAFSSRHAGRKFHGTADAVRAMLEYRPAPRLVLVLAGDHLYRMDYRHLLGFHEARGADATLSAVPVPLAEGRGFGVLGLGAGGRVREFAEKPVRPPAMPGRPDRCLASMGIYVFDGPALKRHLLEHPEEMDFGHDLLPSMLREKRRLFARPFGSDARERFWRDIADVDALHRAHVDLLDGTVELPHGHPSRIRGGSLVGATSTVEGARVERSVVGRGVRVEPLARIEEAVLQDNVFVGVGARLRRCVVEEGARIAAGAVIGYDPEADARSYRVTPGGVVVVQAMPEVVATEALSAI